MTHKPVLLQEMIQALDPQEGATYIDATYGGGGYTKAIKAHATCKVIAFDRDPDVPDQDFPDEFYNVPFGEMAEHVHEKVDGVVFDFGVSSFQLDRPERGFAFRFEGPLDMRMSKSGKKAEDVINKYKEEELANIIYHYGEERRSRRVAKAIVNARPISTTTELAEVVKKVLPLTKDNIHPATKTFQAIRIYVNDELNEIKKGVKAAMNLIKNNAKLITVTFHALEDRVVKDVLKGSDFREIEKVFPSEAEIKENPRARSAKLRCFVKVGSV